MLMDGEITVVPDPRMREPDQVGEALPLYLQEIGRVALLTGPQEVELAQAIRRETWPATSSGRRQMISPVTRSIPSRNMCGPARRRGGGSLRPTSAS